MGLCLLLATGCRSESAPSTLDGPVDDRLPSASATAPSEAVEAPLSEVSGKDQVLASMLGHGPPGGHRLRLAYDLGQVRLAVLDAPGGAEVSLLQLTEPVADLEAAMQGRDFAEGEHPLELLGYDLVRPLKAESVAISGTERRRLRFAWLRQDEVDGKLEQGRGAAIRLPCAATGRDLLVAGEGPTDTYDPAPAAAVAAAVNYCTDAP